MTFGPPHSPPACCSTVISLLLFTDIWSVVAVDSTSWMPLAATRQPPSVSKAAAPASGTGTRSAMEAVSAASVPLAKMRSATWLVKEPL